MTDYFIAPQKMSTNIQRTVQYAIIKRPRKEGARHHTSEKHDTVLQDCIQGSVSKYYHFQKKYKNTVSGL
jgi:hypothetical protein